MAGPASRRQRAAARARSIAADVVRALWGGLQRFYNLHRIEGGLAIGGRAFHALVAWLVRVSEYVVGAVANGSLQRYLVLLLIATLGVGIVPDYMVRESVAQGALQELPLPAGSLDFLRTHKYLLYMPTRFQTRAIQTLTEFVHQRALAEAV